MPYTGFVIKDNTLHLVAPKEAPKHPQTRTVNPRVETPEQPSKLSDIVSVSYRKVVVESSVVDNLKLKLKLKPSSCPVNPRGEILVNPRGKTSKDPSAFLKHQQEFLNSTTFHLGSCQPLPVVGPSETATPQHPRGQPTKSPIKLPPTTFQQRLLEKNIKCGYCSSTFFLRSGLVRSHFKKRHPGLEGSGYTIKDDTLFVVVPKGRTPALRMKGITLINLA